MARGFPWIAYSARFIKSFFSLLQTFFALLAPKPVFRAVSFRGTQIKSRISIHLSEIGTKNTTNRYSKHKTLISTIKHLHSHVTICNVYFSILKCILEICLLLDLVPVISLIFNIFMITIISLLFWTCFDYILSKAHAKFEQKWIEGESGCKTWDLQRPPEVESRRSDNYATGFTLIE